MDLEHLKRISGIDTTIPIVYHVPKIKRNKDKELAYLKSKLPNTSDNELDLIRLHLIVADTKAVTGVDIFEEEPKDFNGFMNQYKLWDNLKS